jgi:Flp pilus assembly pilin Flp
MAFCKNKSKAAAIEYSLIAASLMVAIIIVVRALAQI